jgi:dTDP-4-amino-4,6-dideoxygalactose transaminase
MITTNDSFYYKKINYLREYGWDENRNAQLIGINSRLDEIQAAILNVKLKYLNKDNNERRSIANYYNKNINNYKILKPLEKPNCYHVYHLYVIRCKNRDKLIRELRKKEIFAGIHYTKAVHQQQLFDGNKNYLPITDKISKEVLSLPIYPGLRKKSLKKVIDVINNF